MKVRIIGNTEVGESHRFNISALSEVLAGIGDSFDSFYMKELEVQLPDGSWKPMRQAFIDHDIVPDNLNETFGLPDNEECRARGYNP